MNTLEQRFKKFHFNTLEEDTGGSSINENFFDDLDSDPEPDIPEMTLNDIKQLALFNNVNESKLKEFFPFFTKKFFKKGSLILEQYEENHDIILFSQKVNVEEKTTQSTVKRLEWIFGDEAYSAKEPSSKDVFLTEDHIGYVISLQNFSKVLQNIPEAGKNLLYYTAKRLREERREAVYMEDELSRKDRLLLNINQPWLEITFKGDVTTFHSQKAIRCLGFQNLTTIEGKNFFNLIYKDAPRNVRIEEKKKNQEILKDMFISNTEIMADLLPSQIEVEDKFFHITYDPICEKKISGEKRITAVLVILKDITVEKQLEKIQDEEKNAEKTRSARNANPIGYINMVDQVKLICQMIDQYNFEVIENHESLKDDFQKEMMRNLHTAKGMSGFFIDSLKFVLHDLEDYFREENAEIYDVKKFLNLRHKLSDQFKAANRYMEELGETLLNLIKGFSYTLDEQKELLSTLGKMKNDSAPAAQLYKIVSCKLKAPAEEIIKGWQEDIDRMTMDEKNEENLGKAIDVIPVIKENLYIHKKLIKDLSGVLKHIYRNCVAHGIELPDDRVRTGKPEIGKITVKIWDQNKHLLISIQDDGKGIDPDMVKQTAIQKKLISAEDIGKMNAQDILNLIFRPGFSTVKKITDVAGRGVGMDAVYNLIANKLQGKVSFGSSPRKGSRILLQIPLEKFEHIF